MLQARQLDEDRLRGLLRQRGLRDDAERGGMDETEMAIHHFRERGLVTRVAEFIQKLVVRGCHVSPRIRHGRVKPNESFTISFFRLRIEGEMGQQSIAA